jgi:hypothetical protein
MDFQIDLATAVTLWQAEQQSLDMDGAEEIGKRTEHIYW